MTVSRVQRKRTTGWRMPAGAVYVGRPTKWGNPFAVMPEQNHPRWAGPRHSIVQTPDGRVWRPSDRTPVLGRIAAERASATSAAALAVKLFEQHVGPMGMYEYDATMLAELDSLVGKDLVCWCPLDRPCHADVLIAMANHGRA